MFSVFINRMFLFTGALLSCRPPLLQTTASGKLDGHPAELMGV